MRKLFLIFACMPLFAAIGDHAPSVPSTYVTTHPRLPYPTDAELQALCLAPGGVASANDGCTLPTRFRSTAEGTSFAATRLARYLFLSYAATRWGSTHGHGVANASYLTKIKDMATLGTVYTVAYSQSVAYDWFQASICLNEGGTVINTVCTSGSATLNTMRSNIYTGLTRAAANILSAKPSPYNDQTYITNGSTEYPILAMIAAVYPDDLVNSAPFMRYALDWFFNIQLPAWKQVIGPNGVQTTDDDFDNGGGWHEHWEYVNQGVGGSFNGMNGWLNVLTNTWATASGRGNLFFTQDIPWLKNYGYWMMYMMRPDFTSEINGDSTARPYVTSEFGVSSDGGIPNQGTNSSALGIIDFLAAVYDSPTLRGWSRLLNWRNQMPDGYEPTGWPYYTPDSAAKPANFIRGINSPLATVKNFPGWGVLHFRSGWRESDTQGKIDYGDNFWSHPFMQAGCFTLFNRGPLAIQSGSYRPGSASPHNYLYTAQTGAGNCLTITDPADYYSDEPVSVFTHFQASQVNNPLPNVGGQRTAGSTMILANGGPTSMNGWAGSPSDVAQWMRSRWIYHRAKLVAYAVNPDKYMFAAVDITPAYNTDFSRNPHTGPWIYNEANTSNRTYRAQKVVRQFLFIPRGTAGYLVVYDQIISTNPAFVKKFLLHSINAPVVSGKSYTISRTETVTSKPFALNWPQMWATSLVGTEQGITNCPGGACQSPNKQYIFNGKLYGWYPWPSTGVITVIGGRAGTTHCPGTIDCEYQTTDSSGTFNWSECSSSGPGFNTGNQCGFGAASGTLAQPFAITSGTNDKLLVSIDGGAGQTVTLTAGAARTCIQVIADINAALTDATATCEGKTNGIIQIKSDNTSPVTAKISFGTIANNAATTLGFILNSDYVGSVYDEGLGGGDWVHQDPLVGPHQPGAFRLEETIGADNLSDQMVNVMLATSASDTNLVSTAPSVVLSGTNLIITWKDNSNTCTYTWTPPVDGIGGPVTIVGAGCSAVVN